MSDPFSDFNLMNENIGKIGRGEIIAVRVSAEHYMWLAGGRCLVRSITHTAGGTVEGHPTSVINILQRIRQLVEIEKDYAKLDAAFERHLNPPLKPNPAMKKTS